MSHERKTRRESESIDSRPLKGESREGNGRLKGEHEARIKCLKARPKPATIKHPERKGAKGIVGHDRICFGVERLAAGAVWKGGENAGDHRYLRRKEKRGVGAPMRGSRPRKGGKWGAWGKRERGLPGGLPPKGRRAGGC